MNVFDVLEKSKLPIDAATLISKLKVNKTTVYRQLDKLLSEDKVIEVELGDGKKRYETKSHGHHHHVVCKKCGLIEDLEFDESLFFSKLYNKTNFKIENHNLEFFGLCIKCKPKLVD